MQYLLIAFLFLTLQLAVSQSRISQSHVPMDFNSDGRSEFVTVQILPNGALSFSAFDLVSGVASDLGTIGESGDNVILGNWIGSAVPEIGVVSTASDGTLKWSIRAESSQVITKTFGRGGDLVLSGADFNGNGLADVLVSRVEGRKVGYEVAYDLFSDTPTFKEFSFGLSGELPFLLRRITGDFPAMLQVARSGATSARVYDLNSGAKTLRLRSAPAKERPMSVGPDLFVYAIQNGSSTKLSYFGVGVRAPRTDFTVKANGIVVVGDYLPATGLEVAVHSGATLYVHDRVAKRVRKIPVVEGIAVDEINVNLMGAAPKPPSTGNPTPAPSNPNPPSTGEPVAPGSLDPNLRARCASVTTIGAGDMLIKSEASNHINPGDPRASGYTLVCARQCPSNLNYTQFFYSNGEEAGAVAIYGTFSGNGKPRLYGAVGLAPAHNAREIASRARGIGNGKLYMQISSATTGEETVCKEFNPLGRNGSL